MIGYKLQFKDDAVRSMLNIADFLREQSSEALARRWLRAIDESARKLVIAPQQGFRLDFDPILFPSLRRTLVSGFPNYLLFYQASETARLVLVVDIIHGARDYEAILRGALP